MMYQRTQVSISPEDHAFLTREAASRGVSLAELFRQIVTEFRSDREHPAAPRGFDAIIGIAAGGAGDRDDDTTMGMAMDSLYRKKMGASAAGGSAGTKGPGGAKGRRRR